ncbi:MAG: hypothetical protein HYW06_01370 [Gemmatimonadetes bacterium]|nr:hypothetical protein [Gemmatimonadota bacterium]
MSSLYPLVEAAVVAACLGVILFAVANVAARRGIWPAMAWAAVGLGWFLVVWQLARAGAFEGTRGSARVVAITAAVVSLALGWALLASSRRARSGVADLVTIQASRVVAVVVLLALAGEALPAWLALPIGLGDSLVGLTALGVARRLRGAAAGAARAAQVWNVAGVVLAVFTIAAPIASARSTGYFLSLYPLVLFPTFLAPGALGLHAVTLGALRRPSSPPESAS